MLPETLAVGLRVGLVQLLQRSEGEPASPAGWDPQVFERTTPPRLNMLQAGGRRQHTASSGHL